MEESCSSSSEYSSSPDAADWLPENEADPYADADADADADAGADVRPGDDPEAESSLTSKASLP